MSRIELAYVTVDEMMVPFFTTDGSRRLVLRTGEDDGAVVSSVLADARKSVGEHNWNWMSH